MDKFKNIEFLRFLFILVIIACHIKQGVTNAFNIEIYQNFNNFIRFSWLPVDFFFIIAGFFMFLKTDFSVNFISFAKNKFIRLMPTVLGVLGIIFILSLFIKPLNWIHHENLFTILNLQNVGLTTKNGNIPPSWFVSTLFWVMCFYFYLYKCVKREYFNLITASMVFICYSIFLHVPSSWNIANYFYFINMGVVRGLAGIGAGYFLCILYQNYKEKIKNAKLTLPKTLLITGIELYVFINLFYYLCFSDTKYKNMLFFILLFIILFILFICKKGFFSKLLENNFSVLLGKYTYSIFLIHYLIKDLWKIYIVKGYETFCLTHPIINIVALFIVTLFAGVLTYHIIEKPAATYFKKFK
ncbi:MAG: acyltransferase [Candidatus Gastranaerophilales bacterium]|nr:acyltransferase [Candidatus Gastranaerophilales bacterium]